MQLSWIAFAICCLVNLSFCADLTCVNTCKCVEPCSYCKVDGVTVMCLHGDLYTMGKQYGKILANELQQTFAILEEHVKSNYFGLLQTTEQFLEKHPEVNYFSDFLEGAAYGSGLTFDQLKIMNVMQTITAYVPRPGGYAARKHQGCSFMYMPGVKTKSGNALIGRNYDYATPFDKMVRNLVVAILKETNKVPVAMVTLPGELNCATCFNSHGIFSEINMAGSRGFYYGDMPLMYLRTFSAVQRASNWSRLMEIYQDQINDVSIIVNNVDATHLAGLEFAENNALERNLPKTDEVYVSTNHFLAEGWAAKGYNINTADWACWYCVPRRNNLLKLAGQVADHSADFDTMKQILGVKFEDGGARYERETIYQAIFEPATLKLSLYRRLINASPNTPKWSDIDLKQWGL